MTGDTVGDRGYRGNSRSQGIQEVTVDTGDTGVDRGYRGLQEIQGVIGYTGGDR